jgi:hypothetical protein
MYIRDILVSYKLSKKIEMNKMIIELKKYESLERKTYMYYRNVGI